MSASEKLKALETEIASYGYDAVNAPPVPFPHIVAVVEAAEQIADYMDDPEEMKNVANATLSALKEALS